MPQSQHSSRKQYVRLLNRSEDHHSLYIAGLYISGETEAGLGNGQVSCRDYTHESWQPLDVDYWINMTHIMQTALQYS